MSINSEIADLINADIDGETSPEDQARLAAILAENDEARVYQDELRELCADLSGVEAVEPPPHLRHVILHTLPGQSARQTDSSGWRHFLETLSPVNLLRYTLPFAAGVILTVAMVNTDDMAGLSPAEVSGLVGTMVDPGQPASTGSQTTHDAIQLQSMQISGSVDLYATDSTLKLDFDLTSAGPIEVVTRYPGNKLRFSGFAQLEDSDTSVTADEGAVRVRMAGRQRYVVYLENGASNATSLTVGFYSGDVLVFEDALEFDAN